MKLDIENTIAILKFTIIADKEEPIVLSVKLDISKAKEIKVS